MGAGAAREVKTSSVPRPPCACWAACSSGTQSRGTGPRSGRSCAVSPRRARRSAGTVTSASRMPGSTGSAPPPGRAVVAVDPDGTVLGTAESGPNHGGPAAHVASAGFMVDPAQSGRGVGRALGEHVLSQARADGYRAMQFNAVVGEQRAGSLAVALTRLRGPGDGTGSLLPSVRRLRRPAHHVPQAVSARATELPDLTKAAASGAAGPALSHGPR